MYFYDQRGPNLEKNQVRKPITKISSHINFETGLKNWHDGLHDHIGLSEVLSPNIFHPKNACAYYFARKIHLLVPLRTAFFRTVKDVLKRDPDYLSHYPFSWIYFQASSPFI